MDDERFRAARILVVDDEPANLRLLERLLENSGLDQVVSTADPREVVTLAGDFKPDLILLDLHMPHLDGFMVLEQLRPLLVGQYLPILVLTADVTRAAKERALSSGAKDFLNKPLDAVEVLLRIRNLLETRFLYLDQRLLLEETLQGSVRALADVLALTNPAGFGRSIRAGDFVGKLFSHLGASPQWEVEVAAMLSQIGSVILPIEILEKDYRGAKLTLAESVAVGRTAEVASRVVSGIPRMEGVARILAHKDRRYDGKDGRGDGVCGEEIPWGSRLLKLVTDLDVLEGRGLSAGAAMETIREREGWYDPALVQLIAEMREIELSQQQVVEVEVREVRPGMVLAEDIRTVTDMLLAARGQEVSERLMERLRNSERLLDPRQRVHVILPKNSRGTAPAD